MTFVDGEMHANGKHGAWGFTADAWKDAGITNLNGDWTMRFDFEFPDTINYNFFIWIMFNREPRQLGQDCDICLAWGSEHGHTTERRHGYTANMILPENNWNTAEILQHKNRPFSFLFSRKSDTGHINLKLYRRDTSELQLEMEITKNVQFDDDRVPIGFYINDEGANWNSVSFQDSNAIPSLSGPCTA